MYAFLGTIKKKIYKEFLQYTRQDLVVSTYSVPLKLGLRQILPKMHLLKKLLPD